MSVASRIGSMILFCCIVSTSLPQASAITIIRNHLPAGTSVSAPGFPLVTTTGPPTTSTGGGNLLDIFNAAADIWAVAQIAQFENLNLAAPLSHIPEPSGALLLLVGGVFALPRSARKQVSHISKTATCLEDGSLKTTR